ASFPVTLQAGINLLLFKVYVGAAGEGWDLAARFEDAQGNVLLLPTTLEPSGYRPPDRFLVARRTVPGGLAGGGSGTVRLDVTPLDGGGDVDVTEQVPDGLTPSVPSDGGVVQGGWVTWHLPALTGKETLSYQVAVDADAGDGEFDPVDGPVAGGVTFN